ncbi:prolipoprotein diacylglyceryl transferase [bacterium]|nr:prolipoprotein diacylglyceryl transferase [Verrucomicrobiota bacterium]MDA7645575.1 prolipoprotein diacylglyceryl transferase [bacterium]MDB4746379.1 prolipoprotein diacylglyceryl transferase [Verrucomicrobiota bacterium]
MDPVAFSLGGFDIHWYGVFVAAGFLAGLWTAGRRGLIYGLSPEKTADLGPWIIIGALIGARTLYVVTYWDDDFAGKNLLNVFKIRQGGLVFYGGFIGAALSTILYTRLKSVPLWQIADAFAPSIALGHAFGRLGCLMTGCCYGKVCVLPWAIEFPKDHITHPHSVHPTQIYESGLNLALYLSLAFFYRRKRFEGQVFAVYLMSYAILRAFVEMFRGDYADQKFTGLLTPGQQVGIGIFVAGAALYVIRSRTKPTTQPSNSA